MVKMILMIIIAWSQILAFIPYLIIGSTDCMWFMVIHPIMGILGLMGI
jgi:hypothetical protein